MADVRPLDGIRVLDLSQVIAGPTAATLLADHGADVIKVERPGSGDPMRVFGHRKDGISLHWKFLGRNRRSLTLDPSTPDGRQVLLEMVAQSDVMVESFRPGTLERWNLGFEDLSAVNSGFILARISGFGQTGPMSSRPGFGTLAEAMSGYAHISGDIGGPPRLPAFSLADAVAGLVAGFGILAALRARELTGRGQEVDTSLLAPMLFIMGAQPSVYDQLGIVANPTGGRPVAAGPRGSFRCSDDTWISLASSTTPTAERVMELVGWPEVTQEPWFATGRGRAERIDELHEAIAAWVAERPRAEVLEAMAEAGAAAGPVYHIGEAIEDEQFRAIEAFIRVADQDFGSLLMQNVPVKLSETPGRIDAAGPRLGEHTDEVLEEFGIDEERRAALRTAGVI